MQQPAPRRADQHQNPLPASISDKCRFWSFVSILLIVFLHSYNLQQRFLQPWTTVQEKLTPTSFTEYFVANGLLRFLIPILFAISGFLYALHDPTPNSQRFQRRLRSLLLPYLVWSTLTMTMTYMMELFPYGRQIVFTSGIAYIDQHRRLLHDYHWNELLRSWLFSTISYQLWFLRVLLVYNLAYPLLRWFITNKSRIVRWLFWGLITIGWLYNFESVFVEGEGLLFFSLGIWIQKTAVNLEVSTRRRRMGWAAGALCIMAAAVITWLAFKGQALMGYNVYPLITLIHKLTVASGLIAAWSGLDELARYCMRHRSFALLSVFSFFVYAFHTPWVGYAINPALALLHPLPAFRLLAFILLPLTVIVIGICLGIACRRITPGLYRLLSGGRGLTTPLPAHTPQ
jgi:fucose 4-O-acetylase-like acetyltransferase